MTELHPPHQQSLASPENSQRARQHLLWLLVFAIPACLWLISQAALFGLGANQVNDTVLSNMIADYSKWSPQHVNPLRPELIGTIRSDQATMIAGAKALGTIVPFIPFGTGIYATEIPSETPTASPASSPTASPTPTTTKVPYWPTWTPTPGLPTTFWTETSLPVDTAIPPTTPPVPPLPTVQFSSATYSVGESSGNVAITLTLSSASTQTVTIIYTTSDGTAIAPGDYTSTGGTVTFAPGQVTQTFSIPIAGDSLNENDETFQISLSSPVNATVGIPNPSTVTILDDDTAPSMQFLTANYVANEGDIANLQVVVTVVLSATSGATVSADFATGDITATAGSDYQTASGSLSFAPGQTSQSFIVTVINDTTGPEGNETLSLTLSNPNNATIGANNPASLVIVDDDPVPTLPCTGISGTYTLGDPALVAVDDISLDVGCGQAITVNLGSTPINANGDAAFDLVTYERRNGTTGSIEMDWIIIQIGTSSTGPWLTVFYWGDGGPDSNTSAGRSGFTATEADNEAIPMTNPELLTAPMAPFWITGIGIDVDAFAPPGTYQWLRIFAPDGGTNDPAQVDYIQIITP
jgi:hypothetical protein